MTLKKIIFALALLTAVSAVTCALTLLFFQDDFKASVLKITCFLFYCSILLIGNSILISTSKNTSKTIIHIITVINSTLIITALLILLNVLLFINIWHIILGISILYITSIQLNLLGWSQNKHAIINKVYFFLILCVNFYFGYCYFIQLALVSGFVGEKGILSCFQYFSIHLLAIN